MLALLGLASLLQAQEAGPSSNVLFFKALLQAAGIIEPVAGTPAKTFTTHLKIVKCSEPSLAGRSADFAWQAPDKARLTATIDQRTYAIGRDGQDVWIYAPQKKFGVVGSTELPRYSTRPDSLDRSRLLPVKLPMPREQLAILPLVLKVESAPAETIDGSRCHVLHLNTQPQAAEVLKLGNSRLSLWLRESDLIPAKLGFADGRGFEIEIELQQARLGEPWLADRWKLTPADGDKIESVCRAHILRFLPVALSLLTDKIPTLGPATGDRRVAAREGAGRLEIQDGTQVLFLKGTPEEMGRQHGALLRRQVRSLVDHILYGVGVGSSFDKGAWFFGEIERAQKRLLPFMDDRYLREMDAIALAANLDSEEIRLANFFPELFHCSGFAVFGEATEGGRMYHGRVLDYLKGIGLEQNATVIVHQPDEGNAWVNIGYAGLAGTVTAMNEKHISVGEMGGRGEGNWDGKPMAQLLREVMERANTLDEALAILRKGPRTCEYYYVLCDGKTRQAVGIAATPESFEVIQPGATHPRLPHAVKDAVLMSAGDRYEKLAERVKAAHGKLNDQGARDLMTRPVCMNSNIHSVLFAPDTLDFWVANADSKNVASHCRYTHYNLSDLLKPETEGR
jgi:outer membrane lipoprotein-sorting protein